MRILSEVVKWLFVLNLIMVGANTCAAAQARSLLQELFPDQRSIYSSRSDVVDYRLALAAWKKINNNWVVDREEVLAGVLEKRTLELSDNYHLNEVELAVDRYFEEKNIQELFGCKGLDCGSSNAWANNYFHVKQLYGLDDTQAYKVGVITVDGKQIFFTSYVVQRGNKRIYCQLEMLLLADTLSAKSIVPSPSSILNELEKRKFFRLPISSVTSDRVDLDEQYLIAVVKALQKKPTLKLFVVGQNFEYETLDQQIARSLTNAQAIVDKLIALGVPKSKLQPHGVGSLAPLPLPGAQTGIYLIPNNSR